MPPDVRTRSDPSQPVDLPDVAREAARRFADATAYVAESGWSLTYADLDRVSDEVAAGLRRGGVGPGDVVALVLPPGPEYLLAYLGAAKAGAITAGVNERLSPTERDGVLARSDPALVVGDAGAQLDRPDTVLVEPADQVEEVLAPLRARDAPGPRLEADTDRPVAIVFTSGTTGLPKGALYTNRQLEFITATDVGDSWGSGGRSIAGTSFAHLGFMTKLAGTLRRGGTQFLLGRWRAEAALRLMAEQRMTTVTGVPTQLALMLRHPDFDAFDLGSVRAVITGGGPLTPDLAEETRRRFDAALGTRYSCTEAGIGLGTALDAPDEDASVSVGRPRPGVELALLDEHDDPVPASAVGRVCLRSPAVMREFWRDPESTGAAFTTTGFVRTGDLGWLDDQGRLRLVGRAREMYVRGGYNVYPVEVEGVLSTHPAVAAVAIVPRADAVMGEVGVAVVVPDDPDRPPTLASLHEHAAGRLAAYKLPGAVRVVPALPLTSMEKLDRRALGVLVTAEPDSGVR